MTRLFRKGDQPIDSDVVHGAREPPIVDFQNKSGGKTPAAETLNERFRVVEYDFVLKKQTKAQAA